MAVTTELQGGGASSREAANVARFAGKYLTFILGKEIYGIKILKVQEIIGVMAVTKVPRTPIFVRGVINLRGKVIPVVDLRLKFGMETRPDDERTCIIVVQVNARDTAITMGIIVDRVSEVVDVDASKLEPTPEFGVAVNTDFILAMGKVRNEVAMLLDVDRVLSASEMSALSAAAND